MDDQGERELMARVEVRIDCSPAEFRLFAGRPHLLPLYEAVALTLERFLVCQIAAVEIPDEQVAAMAEFRSKPRQAWSKRASRGDDPGAE